MRIWPFQVAAAASSVVFAAMLIGERGANLSRFSPLNFDRIAPEWVPYFFVLYFAWAWLLLVLWARYHEVRTLAEILRAAKAGDSILVELVFVTAVAGLIPYLLVDFYSPNWKYFTEFQGLVASALVVAFLPKLRWQDAVQRARDGSLGLTSALLLGLMLAVCGHLFITTVASAYRMLRRGAETRAVLAGMPDTAWRQQIAEIRARRSVIVPAFADRTELTECLTRVGDQPAEQRRGIALYVPKTNRTYWDMRQVGDGTAPFIAPSLAGLPMVSGLPEYQDIGWAHVGWGYPQYKLPTAPEAPTENVDLAIDKARKGGFRKLMILRDSAGRGCRFQEVPLQ
jgi:hypothetical protein